MKIEVFDLTECGFYDTASDAEEARFGNLSEWWGEFFSWAHERDYKQTGTFTSSSEPHTVYCIGRTQDEAGNYGVVFWNVSPSVNGRAMHLPPAGLVDDIQAEVAPVEAGSTAGWPTYFWLMPGESKIVALIPKGFRGSGIAHARRYFREYLRKRSSYQRGDGFNQSGFDEPLPLVPKFETERLTRPGPVSEIAHRWRDISKYVSETTFDPPATNQDDDLLDKLKSFLPTSVENSHVESRTRKPRSFRLEVPWRPASRDAVLDAIRSWNERVFEDNDWAGVVANGRLYRFDEMICREPMELSANLDADPRWDRRTFDRIWEEVRPKAYSLINQVRPNSDAQN